MESPTKNPLDIVTGREQEIGPVLGIFTILILVTSGAFYFWTRESSKDRNNATTATTTKIIIHRRDQISTSTPPVASSTSDAELDAIESSLENQTENVNSLKF